jgi:hypothetical protein
VTYLHAFAVIFVKIGLAVIQQKNVEAERRKLIPPTSMLLQCVECVAWGVGATFYIESDWLGIAIMGIGSGSGSLIALEINRRWLG